MTYDLAISKSDLDIIAAGLNELPFKTAAPVFARLQAQCRAIEDAIAQKANERPAGDQGQPVAA